MQPAYIPPVYITHERWTVNNGSVRAPILGVFI